MYVCEAEAKAAAVNQKVQQKWQQAGERTEKWEKTAENTKLELARTRTHLIKVKALVFLYLSSLSLPLFLAFGFCFSLCIFIIFYLLFRFCFLAQKNATRQGIPQSKDNNVQFICVPFFKSQAKAESLAAKPHTPFPLLRY